MRSISPAALSHIVGDRRRIKKIFVYVGVEGTSSIVLVRRRLIVGTKGSAGCRLSQSLSVTSLEIEQLFGLGMSN